MSGRTSTQPRPRHTERLSPDEAGIARAARLLEAGRLVALPTETVYGLGADGRNPAAVASLYEAKGRPRFNPLIAHLASPDAARAEGMLDRAAEAIARAFWPGPLTLVVPAASSCQVCELARAGLPTIGLRVPSHPVAERLLAACGFPVVAPSANRSGHVSPTEAGHVEADLRGRIDAVLDGGPSPIGVESTIVACLEGRTLLLRPGAITRADLERVLGRPLDDPPDPDNRRPIAPGALSSHYAPSARVRLRAHEVGPSEAALSFGAPLPGAERALAALNLSRAGDLTEAAANLFGHLRTLDASGAPVIAVASIPDEGIGEAINDRLNRAASGR